MQRKKKRRKNSRNKEDRFVFYDNGNRSFVYLNIYVVLCLFQYQTLHHKQHSHKSEVDCGKHHNIFLGLLRIMLLVFGEGNQAGKGSDKGSKSADVHCRKQACVVSCKVGQKYCAWYVTDTLAGQDAEQ